MRNYLKLVLAKTEIYTDISFSERFGMWYPPRWGAKGRLIRTEISSLEKTMQAPMVFIGTLYGNRTVSESTRNQLACMWGRGNGRGTEGTVEGSVGSPRVGTHPRIQTKIGTSLRRQRLSENTEDTGFFLSPKGGDTDPPSVQRSQGPKKMIKKI